MANSAKGRNGAVKDGPVKQGGRTVSGKPSDRTAPGTAASDVQAKKPVNQPKGNARTPKGSTAVQTGKTAQTHRQNQYYKDQRKAFPWVPAAVCLLLVVFLCIQRISGKYEIQLCFAVCAAAVFIVFFLQKHNRTLLFEKITPVFVFLFAQCLLFLAGLFYGLYPKFALQQFFLNLGGLFVFSVMYVYFLRDKKNIELFALFFAACIAFVSLVSIELATSRQLLGIFEVIAKLNKTQLPLDFAEFETNTRIFTVLGNANVFAPIAVFGMFAALYSCGKAGSRGNRDILRMSLAVVCGTAFILCFSMGTIVTYIPALAGLIIATKKDSRVSVVLTHAFCLLCAFILAFAVFALREKSVLPVLAVLILSPGLAFGYTRLKPIRLPQIRVRGKGAVVIIVVAVCVAVSVLAALLCGPYSLSKDGTFRRAVALKPGTYTLKVTLDNPAPEVSVGIDSMSYAEAALKEKTALLTATARSGEPVTFEVPDASAAVFFKVTATADTTVNSVFINGADVTKQLPLRYVLLPEFVVNRLQGLWVNDNAIQRFIFFRDGIRLGVTSPVIGLGGGAFEGGLYSVADYKYETKHTHNEYIQDFVDGGALGLALFIALTYFIFRALYKAKKTDKIPHLLPFLFGSMLLVFLHALIEVDFSMPAYRLAAAVLFALATATCEDTFEVGKTLKNTLRFALPVMCAVTVLLAGGRIHAVKMLSGTVTVDMLRTAAVYDPFNSHDYKLSYLVNTINDNTEKVSAQRAAYLSTLENRDLDGMSEYYLSYYYLTKPKPDTGNGIKLAERYIREKRVDPDAWDSVFTMYENCLKTGNVDAGTVNEAVRDLCTYLTQLNESLPKAVVPKLADYVFMKTNAQVQEEKLSVDSRIACDLNRDGKPDLLNQTGDTAEWKLDIVTQPHYLYTVKIYQNSTAGMQITLGGSAAACIYDEAESCFVGQIQSLDAGVKELVVKTDQYEGNTYFTVEETAK